MNHPTKQPTPPFPSPYPRRRAKNYSHDFVEGDVQVSWDLKKTSGDPITAGIWNYRAGEEEDNTLSWLNISTVDLAGGVFDDNGKVEITYYGDDYVCGEVTADDGSSSIKGKFIAKYHLWTF